MITITLVCLAIYVGTVIDRALALSSVPKFCHDVKHCTRRHKVVFVQPPHKPMRAVLKHV